MFVRIVPILVLGAVAACGRPPDSIEDSVALYLDQVSTRVAEVATRAGIPVDRSGMVTAAGGDGGAAVFVPSPHDDGRLVGWLDLPPANPCAARLTPGYYVVEPRITETEAFLTLREIDGSSSLEGLRSDLERNDDDDALHPGRIELGPEFLVMGLGQVLRRYRLLPLGAYPRCLDTRMHLNFQLQHRARTAQIDRADSGQSTPPARRSHQGSGQRTITQE